MQQNDQAGAGQALFPIFGRRRIIAVLFGFLFEEFQHWPQVSLQQAFSGRSVGGEDEGAQGFLKVASAGVKRGGAASFRDVQRGFIKGFLQFFPGFLLFFGGFKALMRDEGSRFFNQGFTGFFFDQQGRDSPEWKLSVATLDHLAEGVELGVGENLLFKKFSQFGEAARTDLKELLNEIVESLDFAVGGAQGISLDQALNPRIKAFLQGLPNAVFVNPVKIGQTALVGGVV